MNSQLLKKVRVIDPVTDTDKNVDVSIVDNCIQDVGQHLDKIDEDTETINCEGLILGTGLVDLYSHSGEPGFEERETIKTLLKAAAAGGFTRVALLPDTTPTIDNPAMVSQLLSDSRNIKVDSDRQNLPNLLPNLYFWGALTQKIAGKQMTELADLADVGIVGFSDGLPLEDLSLVKRLLEYLQPVNKPVALWGCDRSLTCNGVMRECTDSIHFGLPGNPVTSETSAIASLLELVAETRTPVHFMRVSTARSVELIAIAKDHGLPVTASTTWMHLLLDTKAIYNYNQNLRLEPPLGTSKDVLALQKAVKNGTIDAIAIEHTPYTYEEKMVAFATAPSGVIGFELALPLLWENLVETGILTALELWRSLSSNPAWCLQQRMSRIEPGKKAELVLFAPQKPWKVDGKSLNTLSRNTPWLGKEITGRVIRTWC
ncbi:MAG: dihydroorotase [Cyanobacteria bacterium P01_A01_bin.84]